MSRWNGESKKLTWHATDQKRERQESVAARLDGSRVPSEQGVGACCVHLSCKEQSLESSTSVSLPLFEEVWKAISCEVLET